MLTINLPLPAVVSILTRASGVFIFIGMAVVLWLLDMSLSSEREFEQAAEMLSSPVAKFVIWAILAGVIYHALAGLRHMIGDFGYGESLEGGILGARLVLVLSVALIALSGVWIW